MTDKLPWWIIGLLVLMIIFGTALTLIAAVVLVPVAIVHWYLDRGMDRYGVPANNGKPNIMTDEHQEFIDHLDRMTWWETVKMVIAGLLACILK